MTLTEKRTLAVLVDGPTDGMSTSRISELLSLTSNAVGPVVKQFLLNGWVERGYSPVDGRMRFYRLTGLGRQHYGHLCHPHWYRIVSGSAGVGTIVTACQYLGTNDNRTTIAQMLGLARRIRESVPKLEVNGEPVLIGQWVTTDGNGSVNLMSERRFARCVLPIDGQNEAPTAEASHATSKCDGGA